jgi:3-oxoacyl-[acyl-carrier protein] reductase
MTKKLLGKVAVVTGASKGIGAAIAKALALEGAKVVINYARSLSDAKRVVGDIENDGGQAVAIQADLSDPDTIEAFFDSALAAFQRIDILVNNAGIYLAAPLGQITPEHFHRQFNLNVLGSSIPVPW